MGNYSCTAILLSRLQCMLPYLDLLGQDLFPLSFTAQLIVLTQAVTLSFPCQLRLTAYKKGVADTAKY